MNTGYIYKITSPCGKIYIGQTIEYEKRKNHYKGLHCKTQKLLYKSLKHFTFIEHKIEVIYKIINCEDIFLDNLEIFFIKFFNSYYYNNKEYGLNLTKGGHIKDVYQNIKISESNKGRKNTPEHNKKIGDANRGRTRPKWIMEKAVEAAKNRIVTIEEKEKRRKSSIDRRHTEETKKRMSESRKGYKVSEETKKLLSIKLTGFKFTEERNKKISEHHIGSGNSRAILTEDVVYQITREINRTAT